SPCCTTVFPKASVVLKASVVPLNQNVASCLMPNPMGCSYTPVPSCQFTQRATVHWPSPDRGSTAVISSEIPLNSRPRPLFPWTPDVPVIAPLFPFPLPSFIFPSGVNVSMSYAKTRGCGGCTHWTVSNGRSRTLSLDL